MATASTALREATPRPAARPAADRAARATFVTTTRSVRWDHAFVAFTLVQGAVIVTWPSVPLVAVLLWWNANTIAHNFVHRGFFRRRIANDAFSLLLSVVQGVPQRLWRARHLHHHAGRDGHPPLSRGIAFESLFVLAVWAVAAAVSPRTLLLTYLPGWAIGLLLCQLHGYYEHARGTTSHYGRAYNLLFFNDGLHIEHHAHPNRHWTALTPSDAPGIAVSRWPPVLRWLEMCSLGGLERAALVAPVVQRWLVDRHARAIACVISPSDAAIRTAVVVGGGLFPRTTLALRQLRPDVTVTVIDAEPAHLQVARSRLEAAGQMEGVRFVEGRYRPDAHELASLVATADLVVFPLAFDGDRASLYHRPPAARVIVHDWIWARRPDTAIVSVWLLKRLSIVRA